MRFYQRVGSRSGVSVGIIGALVLGVLLATFTFYVLLFAAAVIVFALLYRGGRWLARRRR